MNIEYNLNFDKFANYSAHCGAFFRPNPAFVCIFFKTPATPVGALIAVESSHSYACAIDTYFELACSCFFHHRLPALSKSIEFSDFPPSSSLPLNLRLAKSVSSGSVSDDGDARKKNICWC